MNKRIVLVLVLTCFLATLAAYPSNTQQATLNTLRDLTSAVQGSEVVIAVTGSYPILDYTYYDYDPETFVVDLADVDVSLLPKALSVNSGAVKEVRVETISRGKNRALAKIEVQKEYLAKCLVTVEGNQLAIRIVGTGEAFASTPSHAPAQEPVPEPEPRSAEPAEAEPAPAPVEIAKVEPPPPVAAPAVPAPEGKELSPAKRLTGLRVAEDGSSVVLQTDGEASFKYFTLKNPDRIVVDLPGINIGPVPRNMNGTGSIERVRASLFQADPLVTRVVLDLVEAQKDYSVVSKGSQVVVVLGLAADPETTLSSNGEENDSMAEPMEEPEVEMAAEPALEESIETAPTEPLPEASEPLETAVAEVPTRTPEAGDIENITVSMAPVEEAGSREFEGYEDLFVAQDTTLSATEGQTVMAGGIPLSFREKTITTEMQYTGEPISLSLKDADVKDVLRFFHDISGLNIVVHPSVEGKVTVDLESVPWDQAMDVILKNNGLDYIYEQNLIWVAPASEIARKFSEQQRIQQEKIKAEEPVTFTVRLSYAKVKKLEGTIKRFLSEKGEIFSDERTNSLIIREVPSQRPTISRMLQALDTPTPQVLIEARIVETNITWTQNFGIVWGGNWFSGVDEWTPNNKVGSVDLVHPTSASAGGGGEYKLHGFNNNQSGWPNFGTADFAVSVPAAASNGFIDLMLGNITGSFFLDVRLAALENTGRGRILSAPRVMAQDNEEAQIESGVSIPVSIATADRMSVIFVNATLKLKVTPRISADGNINMEVDITNDSVDYANWVSGVAPPIIKKAAKTSLKVKDGDTVVIGGTFKTTEGISQSGLPFFSKIPVLGWLFKNRAKSRNNEELLIFLTPKIVR